MVQTDIVNHTRKSSPVLCSPARTLNKLWTFTTGLRRTGLITAGKIDILCTGDDFGTQHDLLIHPEMWSDFLEGGFSQFVQMGRAHGAFVMHHSCGSVYKLLPLMINNGLDILQSVQPEVTNMQAGKLKAEFGSELSFHGGVSIQDVLPRATPAELSAHVSELFENMSQGGGYIACTSHNIQADTPVRNVVALFEAYHQWGKY